MLTTAGRTLWATTTIGVRRAPLTVGGIGAPLCRGATVCDSATGLQAMVMITRMIRRCFIKCECYRLPVAGCRLPVAGCRLRLGTGNRQLVTSHNFHALETN